MSGMILTAFLVLLVSGNSIGKIDSSVTFQAELVPDKLYSFLVLLWPGAKSEDETGKLLICGTIINEHYILTRAHIFNNPDVKNISWSVFGIGTSEISIDSSRNEPVQSIHVHPKFRNDEALNVNNLALVKIEKPLNVPEAVISWHVKYSRSTEQYPENFQTIKRMYLLYWSREGLKTYKKRLMHFLPSELKESAGNCPNEKEGYYCIGVNKIETPFPCGNGTIAEGAPLLINNELHGILMGPYQKECNASVFNGGENLVATAVLNLKKLPETDDNLLVAGRFIKETIQVKVIYSNRDLFGKRGPPANYSTEFEKVENITYKHYENCYMSGINPEFKQLSFIFQNLILAFIKASF